MHRAPAVVEHAPGHQKVGHQHVAAHHQEQAQDGARAADADRQGPQGLHQQRREKAQQGAQQQVARAEGQVQHQPEQPQCQGQEWRGEQALHGCTSTAAAVLDSGLSTVRVPSTAIT